MNPTQILLVLCVILGVSQAVVISWEESLSGKVDYRFFFLHVQSFEEAGEYTKPYFGLIDGNSYRPYGALGSLTCPTTASGVAVYSDIDGDGLKEWNCQTINALPFAGSPTESSPPICSSTTSSGTPTLFNLTTGLWYCAGFNHILTAARRGDETPCATADFMYYDGFLEEIRCIDPTTIDEADTATLKRDVQERVDPEDDSKWYSIISSRDHTNIASTTWHQWRWTPSINYDLSSGYSLRPSPPIPIPFESQVIAATFSTFRVNGYLWTRVTPTSTDTFTGSVIKLSSSLSPTVVSNTLTFNSISATSGQVTFGLSTLSPSSANAGETFVASISGLSWTTFPTTADRLMIQISLWVQTKASFTEFFFTG